MSSKRSLWKNAASEGLSFKRAWKALPLVSSNVGAKPTVLIDYFRESGMYIKILLTYAVLIPEVLNISSTMDVDLAIPY